MIGLKLHRITLSSNSISHIINVEFKCNPRFLRSYYYNIHVLSTILMRRRINSVYSKLNNNKK